MFPAPTGPPLRVLCIDDNPEVADSTVDLLRLVGLDARACYDGPAALNVAGEFWPTVCFIDLNMPGMDGDEVAIRLRESAGEWPMLLIAMTAMADEASRERIRNAGFDLHLIKPVDPHDLLNVVNQLWEMWQSAVSPPVEERANGRSNRE